MLSEKNGYGADFGASAQRNSGHVATLGHEGRYKVTARNSDGQIKWIDDIENIVPAQARNHALEVVLAAGTQITSWFLLITDSAPTTADGDTYQSHAGWAEVTAYTQANRPAWTPGSVASSSVDNSASAAAFSINADSTVIGGAALVSDNTKGDSGAGPILYSVGAFSGGDKTLDDGDTLNVTGTFSAQDV